MHPAAFLQRPARWLELIATRRATFSGAPNFAYDLCVARAAAAPGLDLSCWRVAVNGAEPVRPATLRAFAGKFAPCGFRAEALAPGYGLAESVLFVTARRAGSGAVPVHRGAASCGPPGPGVIVRIVDEARRATLPDGETGAIWVAGPSLASGYWQAPDDDAFGARLAGERDAFLRTGDIGFLEGGELFVIGRARDIIVRAGRKAHAADIEHAIAARLTGRSAVFAAGEYLERLVVVHELAPGISAAHARSAIVDALGADFDLIADDIALGPPGAVRLTTSGKIARAATRAAYLAGELWPRARA
jgi:acyl-CoA synthetase (AMP-forming)/AMP-acid ligase II